jgi:peptide/nickel transport system substrate-binding protein
MKLQRSLVAALVAATLAIAAAGCGGGDGSGGSEGSGTGEGSAAGEIEKGGVLRIGTTNYIDSLNPFNYIEAQAYNAFVMIFPQLVQYAHDGTNYEIVGDWAESWESTPDGKVWTFNLKPGGQWSDGTPLTAEDAAWTINTTIEYADGPTAVAASSVLNIEKAEAPDENTLVITYADPIGYTLEQLEQLFILPRHVYEEFATGDAKGLKTFHPEQNLPMVTAGAYTVKQYEKKGTTIFIPDPNYWDEPSNAEAVVLQYYTNSDAMIGDLRQGNLEYVDQVPFNAVKVLEEDENIQVNTAPGAETTNITWNANPRKPKNRELLDPEVKKALSMCIDRDKMIEVVFSGYADKVESIVGHISPLENPNLGPLEYDCDAANAKLDELGYERGPDGIRVAPATTGEYAQPAHKMSYRILQPTSLDFNGERMFDIVQEGWDKLGVETELWIGGDASATYAIETSDPCDPAKNQGYVGWDIAMWDWVGYVDPDFMLSVATKGQWCSWSDTGYDNPEYDKLYEAQSKAVDPEERERIAHEMQQILYDDFVYTQLTNHVFIDANVKTWDGFQPALAGYAKTYWTAPHRVG